NDWNQIKYLALTFIDTLLSSQRTHAQAIDPSGKPVRLARQLFKLSSHPAAEPNPLVRSN
ncbi:hypothetical protein, partial [Nocardia tengchongensis]|uniref:hypothetical protein n=1 Tax=Nocardia tengchongensis TaxID=2055889 RepID=UPI0036859C6D